MAKSKGNKTTPKPLSSFLRKTEKISDYTKFNSLEKVLNLSKEARIELNKWYMAVDELRDQIDKGLITLTKEEQKVLEVATAYKTLEKAGKGYLEIAKSLEDSNGKLSKKNEKYLLTIAKILESTKDEKDAINNLKSIMDDASKATGNQAKAMWNLAENYAKANGLVNEYNKILAQQKGEHYKEIKKDFDGAIDSIKAVAKPLIEFGKYLAEPWVKADEAAASYARAVGMSESSMKRLRATTINFVADRSIVAKYNKSIEDMLKLQADFAERTNRSIRLTADQQELMAATSKLMGDENAVNFLSRLENFGVGMEKASDLASDMFKTSEKTGISYSKLAKNVADNLTLVNKYNFKNGIEGLASMAKKATELKLDMQQVANFAEKVNTVEGAITTAANLQVLGGPFAQMANPMAMLYEGLNDMEALQNRLIETFKNIGTFDREKGEVSIDVFSKWQAKEAAKAMGVSYDAIAEMANRAAVKSDIEQYLRGTAIGKNEEATTLLSNVATYNKKSGRYEIDVNGMTKDIKKLTDGDIKSIAKLNQSVDENVKDIAQGVRGIKEVIEGTSGQVEANAAQIVEKSGIADGVKGILASIGSIQWMLKAYLYGKAAWSIKDSIFNAIDTYYMFRGRGLGRARSFGKVLSRGGNIRGSEIRFFGNGAKGGNAVSKAISGTKGPQSFLSKLKPKEITLKDGTRLTLAKSGSGNYVKTLANGRNVVATSKAGGVTPGQVRGGVAKALTKSVGGRIGSGVAAGVITGGIHLLSGDFKKAYTKEQRDTQHKAIGETIGATAGAAIGSFLGPIGTMIGGFIGSIGGKVIGGAISSAKDKQRRKTKNEYASFIAESTSVKTAAQFRKLRGDYSPAELKELKDALVNDNKITEGELSKKLLEKMEKSGDVDNFKGLADAIQNSKVDVAKQEVNADNVTINATNIDYPGGQGAKQHASGGLIEGRSHAEGGVPILGTNITVQGGEYVINKEATKENLGLLNAINTGTFISPVRSEERMERGGKLSDTLRESMGSLLNKELLVKLTTSPIPENPKPVVGASINQPDVINKFSPNFSLLTQPNVRNEGNLSNIETIISKIDNSVSTFANSVSNLTNRKNNTNYASTPISNVNTEGDATNSTRLENFVSKISPDFSSMSFTNITPQGNVNNNYATYPSTTNASTANINRQGDISNNYSTKNDGNVSFTYNPMKTDIVKENFTTFKERGFVGLPDFSPKLSIAPQETPMVSIKTFDGAADLSGVKQNGSFIESTKEIIKKPYDVHSRAGINPMSVIPSQTASTQASTMQGSGVKDGKFTFNLNGESVIKVVADNGISKDITKDIFTPAFMTELVKTVQRGLLDSVDGGYVKDNRTYKLPTFDNLT